MVRNESVVVVGALIKVKLLWRQKEEFNRAKNWEPLPHTELFLEASNHKCTYVQEVIEFLC